MEEIYRRFVPEVKYKIEENWRETPENEAKTEEKRGGKHKCDKTTRLALH